MFQIGPFPIHSRVLLAPMAGVSDAPFRALCRKMGAGLTTSEMLTADTRLWQSRKSSLRLHEGESRPRKSSDKQKDSPPRSVQIAGSEAELMATAARAAVDSGAQLIDINMGCPAKKVCNKAAGSALLRDESLVQAILRAVVKAVDVPVTLKIRTGWCPNSRNGRQVARIAEDCGIKAIAVHGRTRACRFEGAVEYDTIAAIVDAVGIPVIANGDIDSPERAAGVLKHTGATAVMVGRAAQGQPWLLREIDHYLRTGRYLPRPSLVEVASEVEAHVRALHTFYGDHLGPRIARKHVKWYMEAIDTRQLQANGAHCSGGSTHAKEWLREFNTITSPDLQIAYVHQAFERLITKEDIAA